MFPGQSVDPANPTQYDDQVTLGLACLFSLPGISCLYYGTEQGLHGVGSDLAVREALWGGPGFAQNTAYYKHISQIAGGSPRESRPTLWTLLLPAHLRRWTALWRLHFPELLNGTLAFSRILMDQEIVIVANTNTLNPCMVYVIVDITLNNLADQLRILYSNKQSPQAPSAVEQLAAGAVTVQETDGSTGAGPLNCVQVKLAPLEVQILGPGSSARGSVKHVWT